jgi:hypothetical protein
MTAESLDLDATNPATDPGIVDRQRAQVQLGAAAPLQARAMQYSTNGLGLFDRIDAPGLDL